ncbi:hypothetical protein AB1Y20_007145 [Prymnesium parvum]|uniref:Glycine transporter domain-containing protein n=1 Tax=Prymnesium parvum TaxID=97485 RepID=A0AB34ITY4_PRYPA
MAAALAARRGALGCRAIARLPCGIARLPRLGRSLASEAEESAPTREALSFLASRGASLGIRLSLTERRAIAAQVLRHAAPPPVQGQSIAPQPAGGVAAAWESLVARRSLVAAERRALSELLLEAHAAHGGQRLLQRTATLGVSFLALCSAHTAGESGMHAAGALLVGCVAALGGGTITQLMLGAAPVGWLQQPALLHASVIAALLGFYAWPVLELAAERCPPPPGGGEAVRYALESVALGALAVVGAQQGVARGLQPLVSSCLGVSVAFGGVVRDLMCHRELALGTHAGCQSYALASWCGAATYVALRQLHVWNCAGPTAKLLPGGIPIGVRIAIGAGVAIAVRVFAWLKKPDEIFSEMDDVARANYRMLCDLLKVDK